MIPTKLQATVVEQLTTALETLPEDLAVSPTTGRMMMLADSGKVFDVSGHVLSCKIHDARKSVEAALKLIVEEPTRSPQQAGEES